MYTPFDLLENVLIDIEKGIGSGINADDLAKKYKLSERHLRRLFRFAFNQAISGYIRSRTLSASIDGLLKTDENILDIALDHGFDYEQSYIRAFKREFGITPGDLRKNGHIVKVKPPLNLFNAKKLPEGIIFGPEIVVIPKFHVIGKQFNIRFRDAIGSVIKKTEYFICHELSKNITRINHNFGININRKVEGDVDYSLFMPSFQVKDFSNMPDGFDCFTFETSTCARFRTIGKEFNMYAADNMYKAIDDFMDNNEQQYFLERKKLNIDKYELVPNAKGYRLWEWFAPVTKKTPEIISGMKPSGIINVYKQEIPSLRFIGKEILEQEYEGDKNVLDFIDTWRLDERFDKIESQSSENLKTLYEGGDAFIYLTKRSGGFIKRWLGIFMPKETNAPEEYKTIDFSKAVIGVCQVYGKRHDIIRYDADCQKKLIDEGFILKNESGAGEIYSFLRFNWHRFFEEDKYGKRKLEYCYFL